MAKSVAMKLILASGSTARRGMLERAAMTFEVQPAAIDERAIQDVLMGDDSEVEPADVAELLAEAKARDVSERNPGAIVIGSDQVLEFEDEILSKPADIAQARAALKLLRGSTHQLHSGVAIAIDGEMVWSLVDSASLTMRQFSDKFLASYIAEEGDGLCSSVGAYKLEGRGLQLFERIDGDFFTILGMPLLPLLIELRARGVIAT
jgi:septum formation protein